jgi:hypothetical protein
MDCADQYYGGELFYGNVDVQEAICMRGGALTYCGSGELDTFISPTGADEFDIDAPPIQIGTAPNGDPILIYPGAGLNFSPAGTPTMVHGRTFGGTGSLDFSDLVWSEAGASVGQTLGANSSNVLELPPATSQGLIGTNNAEIVDLMMGAYLWSPNPGSAASPSPGATAFGPVPPPPYPWPGLPGWWFAGQ